MNLRASRLAVAVASLLVSLGAVVAVAPAQAAPSAGVLEHRRIVDFWTIDKVRQAIPRDFVADPATGRFSLKAGPAGAASTQGTDWTRGGLVQTTTGKVLFAMSGVYYVCSASVVKDDNPNLSVILTAGHCAWENETSSWATNWMFIPDYDSAPVPLTTDGSASFCAATRFGCWTAQALVASTPFSQQTGFTTTATLHDYAFATVGLGGNNNLQLDAAVGAQTIKFSAGTNRATTDLFGYPAARPYDGKRLIYSEGTLGYDLLNRNRTYRVASNMTGGCSGGPWFQSLNATTGEGVMMSVNSYGYSGIKALFGPVLNSETSRMFTAAKTAAGNQTVS